MKNTSFTPPATNSSNKILKNISACLKDLIINFKLHAYINFCFISLVHTSLSFTRNNKKELPKLLYHYFINLLGGTSVSSLRLETLKLRKLRILLFPVVAPLILLGWCLYVIGDRQATSNAMVQRKKRNRPPKESNDNEDKVEMGLMEQLMNKEI